MATKYELLEQLNTAVAAVKGSADTLAKASNQQRPFSITDLANVISDQIGEIESVIEVLIDETSLEQGDPPSTEE